MIRKQIAAITDFSGGQDTRTPIIAMGLTKSPNMRNFHCAGVKERLVKRGGYSKINSSEVGSDNLDVYYPSGYQTFDYALRDATSRTEISQGFKPKTSAAVQKVRLWLKKTSTPTGNINIELQTDSSGVPSGSAVSNGTSVNIDISTLTTSYAWYTFTFSTGPTLTADTQYHLVLQGDNTINGTAYAEWGTDDYDVVFPDGTMSAYDATTWEAQSKYNAVFEMYITGGAKGNDCFSLFDFSSRNMLLGMFGTTLYKMEKDSLGTPDGAWDNLFNVSTEVDLMEYATDGAAQAAYVSSDTTATIDSNTKLAMHMDGADAGTTFPDSSTDDPKGNATVTADVNTVTAVKKWGTASADFDGDSGFLQYADSPDWDLMASTIDDWTIDFWVKHNDHVGNEEYVAQRENDDNTWGLLHIHGNGIFFFYRENATTRISISGGEITDTDWHHIALVKKADEFGIYKDGVQVAYSGSFTNTDTFAGILSIGATGATNFLDGYMDELRIQKSNIFSASPNSTPDDTITVPTGPYSTDGPLQSYSESTIKTQGLYSLKSIAAIASSLNDTLTKSSLSIDLSNENTLKFDIRSNRTGSNIKIGIHDSGGTTTEITPNITVANVFQTVTWDLSAVSNANKDDIDEIIITVLNADAETTFYIDNFYAASLLTTSRYWTFADWQSGRALINTDIGLFTYLGTGAVSSVAAAPISKFVVIWRNYVFAAGVRGSPNTIKYSNLSDYATWDAANTLNVNTNDGDVITGMRILKGKLYIFKRYSIHRISFLGSNPTFQVDQILGIGCPAHYTIKEVEIGGELGTVLVFLTTDKKLALFDGYNVQIINENLTEETNDLFEPGDDQPLSFSDMNLTYADCFHSTVKTDTSEYILYCVLGTDTVINYAFVFDYKTGGVYPYDGQPFASSLYAISTSKAKILYCAGYTGYMWQMESGDSDDGTDISAYWVSPRIKPGSVGTLSKSLQLGISFKQAPSVSTINLYFQFRIDWNVSWTTAETFAYNRADDFTFGKTVLIDIGTVENMLQMKIKDDSSNPAVSLYSLDLAGVLLGLEVGDGATS